MSQIATFYTLSRDQSDLLLAAATPETKLVEKRFLYLFKKQVEEQVDHFWDFIEGHAAEQKHYPYSGAGFVQLDLLLEEKDCMLYDLGQCDFARTISEARGESIGVFGHTEAAATLAKLDEVALSEADVRRYFQEDYPSEDEDLGTEAVLAAFDICKEWMASVGENEIGLLIVS